MSAYNTFFFFFVKLQVIMNTYQTQDVPDWKQM